MFVLGCNCNGEEVVGHSMIIDPYGNVIAEAGKHEQVFYGTLELSSIDAVRGEVTYLDDCQPYINSNEIV